MSNLSPAAILYDSSGTEKGTSGNPVRVDPTGTTAQPVTDNGSSLTVDGTVTANAGTGTFSTNVAQYGGVTVGAGNALHVQPGTGASFPVTDNGGSLTVDGTVAAVITDGTNTQPTGDVAARAIYGYVTDGTNTAAVKAASTAALAADPSLVVGLSPNSPLPTGTNAIGTVTAVQATAANLNTLAAQGAATTLAGGWPVKVTDGTNTLPTGDVAARSIFTQISDGTTGPVAVKAASTAALAADKSLVTAFSPNSPLPVGTNEIGKVAQGTAAALTGYWPVRHTDGTNTLPTADVAARALFSKVTDGTNTLPTGDVAARSIYTRVSDGTNTMPVGDVATRAAFTQISDGTTGPVAVIGASASPTVTDKSLVVQISPNQDPIPTTVVPATSIAGSAIGRVSGITANTFTAVRQTTYVEQTTNAQRSIVSTSANDSAAGTGARQVRITYLTATGTGPFTETVTLNGLTAVNTVATDICFIERMDVTSVGSNGSNVGTLNLYTGTGATGTIFAAIGTGALATGVGDNQTLYAHHYVPVNYRVTGYYISCGVIAAAGGGSSTSIIRYRNPTVTTSPWMLASDIINAAQGNSASRVYYVSINIPGPLVLLGYSTPGTNNSTLTVSFDYADAPI